jgi:Zn-dependent protease with chaperone function
MTRIVALALVATALLAPGARAAEVSAVVQKPGVDVYAEPRLDAPKVTALLRGAMVTVSAQQGLWYRVQLPAGAAGFVRVNDVRVSYAGAEGGEANVRALLGGKTGEGRVTETAGVRGIDESELKAAALDTAQLNAMIGNRVDAAAGTAYAAEHGRQATTVAYDREARAPSGGAPTAQAAESQPKAAKSGGGLFGSLGRELGSMLGDAAKSAAGAAATTAASSAGTTADTIVPKSDAEVLAAELALGPEVAGRVLGARPLWNDADAQRRVNLIGRWVASQTGRPDLPWTFAVIDTPEVNAYAAPGGFILVARGMYELLSSDGEVAAVLGHEISHCVQSDHYNVIRKQELASYGKDLALREVDTGSESVAGSYARRYAEQYGATVLLTALDREAEYRADEAAEIYLARSGMNPLALYAVLQKMTALGTQSAGLAQLHKTHPPLDERLNRIDRRGHGALEPYLTRE